MPIRNASVLLDTHAWIWAVTGDLRAKKLKEYSGRCAISLISVWEVGMLVSKGRLELFPTVETWVETNLKAPMQLQPFTAEIALRSSRLEAFHGDPADRILVATALQSCQPLVTADQKIVSWFQVHPELRHLCLSLD